MKAIDDHGNTLNTADLVMLATARGKVLQILMHDLAKYSDMARAGKHDDLAAAVIQGERDLTSLIKTMNQGITRTH